MERRQHKVWPEGRPHNIELIAETLDDNLRNSVKTFPNKAALIFYDAELTYAQIDKDVDRICGWLQSVCGVEHGDRVGLFMQNSPQFVIGYYAIVRAGGVVVPINAMNLTEEAGQILEDSGARVLLTVQNFVERVAPHLESGLLTHVAAATYSDALGDGASDLPPAEIAEPRRALPEGVVAWADILGLDLVPRPVPTQVTDLCVMPFTSGSTGRAKGCMHTHQTTQHAMTCINRWFEVDESDVFLSVAPMFHVAGMQAGMNNVIAAGATNIILPRWDRDVAAHLIRKFKPTAWSPVPTMIIDFVNRPDLKDDDLATLRAVWGGGSAMPASVAEKLFDMTGCNFVECYGLSETIAGATANPPDRPIAQCGGIPFFNTDVVIVDPDTLEILPPDEIGEILISGPQLMVGYWGDPESTDAAFVELEGQRFFRTGDLGRMDDNGYVFIVDRLKRMINASGFKVWPAEVETILYRHPAVVEACIIAANDSFRGQTVKAVVVLKPESTLDIEDLKSWSRDHMAAYKVPRLLEVVEKLPKSGSGKVLWRELQEAENRKPEGAS